jgi:uncharacterized protein (DUF362 family)
MQTVAVVQVTEPRYPAEAPFHPSEPYPEYPFGEHRSPSGNPAYQGVREAFRQLGLDAQNYGQRSWNPLGFLVQPGMTVVLKPNFVLSNHRLGKDLYAIVTHPAVLRAVADYVWIALRGRGRILIADAPQYDCNFQELLKRTQLPTVVGFYSQFSGPTVSVRDLRRYWSAWKHFESCLQPLPGDPEGTVTINLGSKSALHSLPHPEKLYGAVYDRNETIAQHHDGTHKYEVAGTIMKADVVISIPKLKVHKKVGTTLNAKGLVGICTNKNYLVHYRVSPCHQGGDQYPEGLFTPTEEFLIRTERWMYDHLLAPHSRALEYLHRAIYSVHNATTKRLGLKVGRGKRQLDAGNWYGNDSAWRMAVDLMAIFRFADSQGELRATPQRPTLSVIDGVIGGENDGPLAPDPLPAGVILAGENLLAVDLVATRLMGFDALKLKMYAHLLQDRTFDFGVRKLEDIEVRSANRAWLSCLRDNSSRFLDFAPHPGWIGHIEINPQPGVEGAELATAA